METPIKRNKNKYIPLPPPIEVDVDKNPLWVGIDPGLHGSLSAFDKNEDLVIFKKFSPNFVSQAELIRETLKLSEACYVIVERVHSMPHQGVASMFTFGTAYGVVIGSIVASSQRDNVFLDVVSPQEWRKALGLRNLTKDEICKKIQKMYPEKLNDIALRYLDSIAIAIYCQDHSRFRKKKINF